MLFVKQTSRHIMRRKFKMKKVISTIVAVALLSNLLINSAYAGDYHGADFNPLWVPVAILSTLVAAVALSTAPVVHEQRVVYEPRQTVVYQEPRQVYYQEPRQTVVYNDSRHYRHARHDDRYYDDRGHGCESPRYRDYR
jgi:hypothetical protein